GITFQVLMDPFGGPINEALAAIGIPGPGWLTDPSLALLSVALVDVWKGVGLATVIYMAGIVSIPQEYFEAARVDGAGPLHQFRHVLLPLARPATVTVIILSLIGGLRSFDLIWAMTRGGPGFTSDVIASVIYKQYQAGFYGLSTAGNVLLFVLVTAIVLPLSRFLNRKEAGLGGPGPATGSARRRSSCSPSCSSSRSSSSSSRRWRTNRRRASWSSPGRRRSRCWTTCGRPSRRGTTS